jgi:hypothetical protein
MSTSTPSGHITVSDCNDSCKGKCNEGLVVGGGRLRGGCTRYRRAGAWGGTRTRAGARLAHARAHACVARVRTVPLPRGARAQPRTADTAAAQDSPGRQDRGHRRDTRQDDCRQDRTETDSRHSDPFPPPASLQLQTLPPLPSQDALSFQLSPRLQGIAVSPSPPLPDFLLIRPDRQEHKGLRLNLRFQRQPRFSSEKICIWHCHSQPRGYM